MRINFFHIIGFFIGLCLCMALLLSLSGCNTSKSLTDKSVILSTDSIHTEYITVHDTVTVVSKEVVHDSIFIESKSDTGIDFIEGGGTYNSRTGEATGVKGVSVSEVEKSLRKSLSEKEGTLTRQTETIKELSDSIATLNQHNDIVSVSTSKSTWYWWLIAGFVVGVALVIFLKKFPYTKPFMIWL